MKPVELSFFDQKLQNASSDVLLDIVLSSPLMSAEVKSQALTQIDQGSLDDARLTLANWLYITQKKDG